MTRSAHFLTAVLVLSATIASSCASARCGSRLRVERLDGKQMDASVFLVNAAGEPAK